MPVIDEEELREIRCPKEILIEEAIEKFNRRADEIDVLYGINIEGRLPTQLEQSLMHGSFDWLTAGQVIPKIPDVLVI